MNPYQPPGYPPYAPNQGMLPTPSVPPMQGVLPTPMMPPMAYQMPPMVMKPPVPSGGTVYSAPPVAATTPKVTSSVSSAEIVKAPITRPVELQTTVYIGKIPPGVEDEFIRKVLEQCGKVSHWRRVADPVSGKLKGFGFCDYESPEGVLRALRILNGYKLETSELLVKVDEKTQKYLSDYEAKKISFKEKTSANPQGAKESIEEEDSREDEAVREVLKQLVYKRKRGEDWRTVDIDTARVEARLRREKERQSEIKDSLKEHHDADNDRVSIVSREIQQWRDRLARGEVEKDKRSDSDDDEREERDRRMRMERDREREREMRRKEREEREFREKEKEWENRERARERERERERDRERREREREKRDEMFDDMDRKKRTKEYMRRKREREKEREEDAIETNRERAEAEAKRREEERKREEKERAIREQRERLVKLDSLTGDGAPVLDRSKLSGFALGGAAGDKKKPIVPVFGEDQEEEDEIYQKKKRKLVMLDIPLHEQNDKKAKLEVVKSIIEQIPKERDAIFNYELKWDIIEKHHIVVKKLKPWISRKIADLMGEEQSMVEFIVKKINERIHPSELLKQLHQILDEDAEQFMIKMWRMLIYEMLSASLKSN